MSVLAIDLESVLKFLFSMAPFSLPFFLCGGGVVVRWGWIGRILLELFRLWHGPSFQGAGVVSRWLA